MHAFAWAIGKEMLESIRRLPQMFSMKKGQKEKKAKHGTGSRALLYSSATAPVAAHCTVVIILK